MNWALGARLKGLVIPATLSKLIVAVAELTVKVSSPAEKKAVQAEEVALPFVQVRGVSTVI